MMYTFITFNTTTGRIKYLINIGTDKGQEDVDRNYPPSECLIADVDFPREVYDGCDLYYNVDLVTRTLKKVPLAETLRRKGLTEVPIVGEIYGKEKHVKRALDKRNNLIATHAQKPQNPPRVRAEREQEVYVDGKFEKLKGDR